uniref:Uncharacterized protein n=1 Tax=viral metagenome TaxID=1070528 RepID=A0A6M3LLI2_9ZZZZ
MKKRTCQCGNQFVPRDDEHEMCKSCESELVHDANVTMFGDDADCLEHAGLDGEIGNQ